MSLGSESVDDSQRIAELERLIRILVERIEQLEAAVEALQQ